MPTSGVPNDYCTAENSACRSSNCLVHASAPVPVRSDCNSLINYLANRGSTFTFPGNSEVAIAWNTCLFTVVNTNTADATWCDSNWARISSSVAGSCFLPEGPKPGGECDLGLLTVKISRNTAEVLTTPGESPNNPPPTEGNPTPTGNSSTNPSSGSSTSAPNVSITTNVPGYTPAPLPGISQQIPGGIGSSNPSSATRVGPPVGSPGGDENKSGISIGTVAGITVGVAVLLIGIGVFWILRRRARLKEEPLEERQQDTTAQPGMSTTVHPFVSGPYEDWANPPGPSSDRTDFQGLAAGEKGGRPIVQPPLEEPNGNGVGENNLESTRAMVSETIPHLSQRDIDRLAEVVIQRMPTAAMRAGSDAGALPHDHPPSWRDSWDSRRTGEQP